MIDVMGTPPVEASPAEFTDFEMQVLDHLVRILDELGVLINAVLHLQQIVVILMGVVVGVGSGLALGRAFFSDD